MPQRKIIGGFIVERQDDGTIVTIGPANAQPQMPVDPTYQYRGQAAATGIAAQQSNMQNDAARLELARQEAARAAEKAASDRENEADKQRTLNARGGVESTEGERKAAFLATRLAGGLRDLTSLGNLGAPSLKDALAAGSMLGNYATDEERQRAVAAQREILDPALTLGTGAAYTEEQLDNYRKAYFPQPGDQPGTITDKNRRLQTLLNAAKLSAGASASMIDGALAPMPGKADAGLRPGTSVRDGGEYDDKGNFLGLAGSVTDEGPGGGGTPAAPAGDFRDSYAGQGISGVNKGLAGMVGAPVDLTTAALNLGSRGINALTNSDLPAIEKPFMGSEYLQDKMGGWGIYGESKDPSKQFVRRVGESVGSALIPAAGTANRFAQAAKAIGVAAGGGVGAATAQQVFPGNRVAEFAGEMAGGGLTGAGLLGSSSRVARRQMEANIPTVQQLKDQAGGLYRQAEARGVTAEPLQTQQMADDMRRVLRDEGHISPTGRISEVYPKAKEAMQLADDYAGSIMNPKQMQTVRKVLGDGMMSPEPAERRTASLLTDVFDDWSAPMAPELAQARDVSSRYLNAQTLEQARELAGARAGQFSGSGYENALRTDYRALDRNAIKGRGRYGDDVRSAIENVSRGTPMSNAARAIGRLTPSSPMAIGTNMSITSAGALMGGPAVGGALGAGVTGMGLLGRHAATKMGLRNAELAELTARNGGALPVAPFLDPETQAAITASALAAQPKYLTEEEKKKRRRQ